MKQIFKLAIAFSLCMILIAEISARQMIDLKLYGADDEVGYWVLPNQKGDAVLTGSFAFNSLGLGVAQEFEPRENVKDVVLIGDSIVLGIAEIKQSERLGPALDEASPWKVWPLAAGSWAMWNELRMLRRHPELTRSDAYIFVVNSGDFAKPSEWESDLTHPRSEPYSYLIYVLRKKLKMEMQNDAESLNVYQSILKDDFNTFVEKTKKPIYIIGYSTPSDKDPHCDWVPDWLKKHSEIYCYDVSSETGDGEMFDDIHPTAKGNRTLAKFIYKVIENNGEPG